jgi:hypothetical protein
MSLINKFLDREKFKQRLQNVNIMLLLQIQSGDQESNGNIKLDINMLIEMKIQLIHVTHEILLQQKM